MSHITITDIYGNVLTTSNSEPINTPFIVINCTQPSILIERANMEISDSISYWKIKKNAIYYSLNINKINHTNYGFLGDLSFPSRTNPTNIHILMVHKNISCYPLDYIKMERLNIWKPVTPQNYGAMGGIFSVTKPRREDMKLVDLQYLIELKDTKTKYGFLITMGMYDLNVNKIYVDFGYCKDCQYDNLQHNIKSQELTFDTAIQPVQETWTKKQGKRFVLVEPNNPWFINKQHSIPKTILQTEYKWDSDFVSEAKVDPHCVEGFSTNLSDKQFNVISCSFLLLVIGAAIYANKHYVMD